MLLLDEIYQRRAQHASRWSASHLRHIVPESRQAFGAAKQGREVGGVHEQDTAAAFAAWRHPETGVEFPIAGRCERMRPGQIDGLVGDAVQTRREIVCLKST